MTKQASKREEAMHFLLKIANGDYNTPLLEKARAADRIISLAKQLRKLFERQCNGYQTWDHKWDEVAAAKDERKEARLKEEIGSLVTSVSCGGFVAYFQGDPRGAAVEILVPGQSDDSVSGFAVPDWV